MNRSASRMLLFLVFASLGFLLHRICFHAPPTQHSHATEVHSMANSSEIGERQRSAGHAETWNYLLDQHAPDQTRLRNLLIHWARVVPKEAMAALDRDFLLIDDADRCLHTLLHHVPLAEAENVIDTLLENPRLRHAALSRGGTSGVERLFGDLAKADADRAWTLARSLPPGGLRGHLSSSVMTAVSRRDFPRITALALQCLGESQPGEDRERLIDAMESQGRRYFDPEEFAAWKDTIQATLPQQAAD